MTSRLPFGLRERPDEPGHGVLMRLAARNGYSCADQFARSLTLDFRKILTGSEASLLARLAGLDPDKIDRSSPTMIHPHRKVELSGQIIELGDWSTRSRRYCPACHALDVEEASRVGVSPIWFASHRTSWDVRLISACPTHGIALMDHCHACDEELGWRSTNILRCGECPADLLAAPHARVVDNVGMYVSRRMTSEVGGNDVLDRLPLYRAMQLCERLGLIEAAGAVRTLPRQSPHALAAARSRGLRMTADLGGAVFAALDKVTRRSEESGGLHAAYGWIYGEWLAAPDEDFQPVRRLLFEHAVANGVISSDEARLGNDAPETITMTQASRFLGMGYKRARDLAANSGIVPPGSRRSVAFTIDPKAVAGLRELPRNSRSLRSAAISLCTGKAQVADLLKAHLLQSDGATGVDPSSITQLIDDLIRQCCAGQAPKGWLKMAIAARDSAVPLWRIVGAVRDGLIPSWQASGEGLSQFQVRLPDVLALRSKSNAISVEAVARRIGVHHECARALAKGGMFQGESGPITEAGIDRFERDFVSGSVIARRLGRSPRFVRKELLAAGVRPAFDPKTHRQAVYRRLDIMGLARMNERQNS